MLGMTIDVEPFVRALTGRGFSQNIADGVAKVIVVTALNRTPSFPGTFGVALDDVPYRISADLRHGKVILTGLSQLPFD